MRAAIFVGLGLVALTALTTVACSSTAKPAPDSTIEGKVAASTFARA